MQDVTWTSIRTEEALKHAEIISIPTVPLRKQETSDMSSRTRVQSISYNATDKAM